MNFGFFIMLILMGIMLICMTSLVWINVSKRELHNLYKLSKNSIDETFKFAKIVAKECDTLRCILHYEHGYSWDEIAKILEEAKEDE